MPIVDSAVNPDDSDVLQAVSCASYGIADAGASAERERLMSAIRSVLIVGGGTAGWLTAAFLARVLGTASGGVRITLVESSEIGIIGVGEGTFPSIKGTLSTIGVREARFLRESTATFK